MDASQRAVDLLGDRLPEADRPMLQRMLTYFDRSSLWLAKIEGDGDDLVLYLANEAERFRVDVVELRAIYADLLRGQRLDWSTWQIEHRIR
ncbi:MAG: hypothetical protein ACYTF0_04175 [Planctomycetota bacterium]